MEVQVHSAEVDLQFGAILLLLQKLHLSFSLLSGLSLLKFFLSLSSFSLLLLIVFLLLVIKLALGVLGNWLGHTFVSEIVIHFLLQWLHLSRSIICFFWDLAVN